MNQSFLHLLIAAAVVILFVIGSHLALTSREEVATPLTILIYETDEAYAASQSYRLLENALRLEDVTATVFGFGQEFEGYGSKYAAVYPVLESMDPESLVILSDSRDVLLNNPASRDTYLSTAAEEFRMAFFQLTAGYPNAVVISAEAQCCVSALSHVVPGDYFNADGSRNQRACASGEDNCLWVGDGKGLSWRTFMKDLAIDRSNGDYDDVYLNAGLMAGTARDLIRLIELASIGKDEDDQAVLTDFMYNFPDSIVLDYGQTMFGNNRGGLGGIIDGTCMFTLQGNDDNERLVHTVTETSPLFVHSPGSFQECHEALAAKLGYNAAVTTTGRRLKEMFDGSVLEEGVDEANSRGLKLFDGNRIKAWKDGKFGGDRKGCNYAKSCTGKK